MRRGIVFAGLVACSSPASKPPVTTTTTTTNATTTNATATTTTTTTSASPPAVDRCNAYVEREVAGMSWYIGPYGVVDWVDLAVIARVTREQCATYSDTELGCASKDESSLDCLSDTHKAALRSALDPALELPAEVRARAKAAKSCESYSRAMEKFEACAAVPARFRKLVTRAWGSTAGVQTPPFACHVGSEVMALRLAAIGC